MVRVVREVEIVRQDQLIERAAQTGEYLANELKQLQLKHQGLVLNIRGMGLYQGFSLPSATHKRKLIQVALEQHSLLLLGGGERSIRLRPNLNVTTEDVDLLIEKLDLALCEIS